MKNNKLFLIHSFPRSGNHLVRSFMEIVSKRPTLGCPTNSSDRPILSAYVDSGFLYTRGPLPIGLKSHFRSEYDFNQRRSIVAGVPGATILIFRNPRKALESHFTRYLASGLSDEEYYHHQWIKKALSLYDESVEIARREKKRGANIMLSFERLVEHDSLQEWLRLEQFMRYHTTIAPIDLSATNKLNKCVEFARAVARSVKPDTARSILINREAASRILNQYHVAINKQVEAVEYLLRGL